MSEETTCQKLRKSINNKIESIEAELSMYMDTDNRIHWERTVEVFKIVLREIDRLEGGENSD